MMKLMTGWYNAEPAPYWVLLNGLLNTQLQFFNSQGWPAYMLLADSEAGFFNFHDSLQVYSQAT